MSSFRRDITALDRAARAVRNPTRARRPAFFTDRVYLAWRVPGISGFQQWDKREYVLITGQKARNNRHWYTFVGEYAPASGDRVTLGTSRMPEFREQASGQEAVAWLGQNPWDVATFIAGPHGLPADAEAEANPRTARTPPSSGPGDIDPSEIRYSWQPAGWGRVGTASESGDGPLYEQRGKRGRWFRLSDSDADFIRAQEARWRQAARPF